MGPFPSFLIWVLNGRSESPLNYSLTVTQDELTTPKISLISSLLCDRLSILRSRSRIQSHARSGANSGAATSGADEARAQPDEHERGRRAGQAARQVAGRRQNLYLDVDADDKGEVTRRRWLFFFASGGKRSEMGLGPYPAVGLADARAARDEAPSDWCARASIPSPSGKNSAASPGSRRSGRSPTR